MEPKNVAEKRKRGRPRTLPEFNPEIPTIIRTKYDSLVLVAEMTVADTVSKGKLSGLRWLSLWSKLYNVMLKRKMLEENKMRKGPKSFNLTTEEHAALMWVKYKGKYDWQAAIKKKTPKQ